MSRLDDELKMALQRREPSADFVNRVMTRVPLSMPRKPSRSGIRSWLAAAAALAIAIIWGAAYEYQQAEKLRIEGERARAELVFALELTSEKLQFTKQKVLKHVRKDL